MKTKNSKPKSGRLFFAGLICLLIMFTIVPRAKTILELSARKEELQKEKAVLVKINSERKKELVELNSPEVIERIAREQLGMVKDGEKIVVEVISNN